MHFDSISLCEGCVAVACLKDITLLFAIPCCTYQIRTYKKMVCLQRRKELYQVVPESCRFCLSTIEILERLRIKMLMAFSKTSNCSLSKKKRPFSAIGLLVSISFATWLLSLYKHNFSRQLIPTSSRRNPTVCCYRLCYHRSSLFASPAEISSCLCITYLLVTMNTKEAVSITAVLRASLHA